MKNFRIFVFVFISSITYHLNAQYTVNLDELKLYQMQISVQSDEQKNRLSDILTQYEGILTGSVNSSGILSIVTEKVVDINLISFFLQENENIQVNDINELPFEKQEYLFVYNDFRRNAENNFSGRPPVLIQMQDKEKQERAYSLAKKIWIELYPDDYKSLYRNNSQMTPEQIKEKEMKMSNKK